MGERTEMLETPWVSLRFEIGRFKKISDGFFDEGAKLTGKGNKQRFVPIGI
jgi:hypothetical protein